MGSKNIAFHEVLKISNVFIIREFVGLNYIDISPNFMMSHRYRVKIMGTGVIP
jgi:hypothetical protein